MIAQPIWDKVIKPTQPYGFQQRADIHSPTLAMAPLPKQKKKNQPEQPTIATARYNKHSIPTSGVT